MSKAVVAPAPRGSHLYGLAVKTPAKTGRGADFNPHNRFLPLEYEPEPGPPQAVRTQFFRDDTRTLLSRNRSPDVGFSVSLNPYRGCEHGCSYCFARPTHEYLGWSAGLDFESRILVKTEAPELLRRELESPRWEPQPLAMSGVTDCYQPIERRLGITRGCLAVLAEYGQPVALITKNHLITRDIDHLASLAARGAAEVNLSLTTLDAALARELEPRASPPARRLAAIRELAQAGIPVRVMASPLIPGLNDHELPAILTAAAEAGARAAAYIPVRLPGTVAPVFEQWLETHHPGEKGKIMERIRALRGGRLNDPAFGSRMRGQGEYAEALRSLFHITTRRLGIAAPLPPLSTTAFRRPGYLF